MTIMKLIFEEPKCFLAHKNKCPTLIAALKNDSNKSG